MVIIRQKDSYNKKEKEKTKKYNFQGKSERSIGWFDLDQEWLEEKFRTCELYFYENFIKIILDVQEKKTYPLFVVPIGNAKINKLVFHPESPVLKYHQKSSNSCCLRSSASDFHSIGDNRAKTSLADRIKE